MKPGVIEATLFPTTELRPHSEEARKDNNKNNQNPPRSHRQASKGLKKEDERTEEETEYDDN